MLLTIGGRYSDASDGSEHWQVGIRLALVFGSVDPKGTLPTWTVGDDATTHTLDDWTIETTWGASSSGHVFNPADYLNDQAIPAIAVWAAANVVPAQVLTDTVKLKPINDLGHVIGLNVASAHSAGGVAGTEGGSLLPLQNSVVASWQTPVLGAKGKGRIYTPGVSTNSIDSHGNLTSTALSNHLAAQTALLEGLAFDGTLGADAHVRPIVSGHPYVNYGRIDEVRIGDRVDTQRRRRRQLVETYTVGAVSY
jgi:hypothetical protein